MKSRISVDVDHDNQPIIKIEYSPSEDVRDKLVKKFLETFGGDSKWAEFYFVNDAQTMSNAIHGQANSTAQVRPISPFQMTEQITHMTYMANEHKKMLDSLIPKELVPAHLIDVDKAVLHSPRVLSQPLLHSIEECLAELKFGRPGPAQKFLDDCIKKAHKLFPNEKV